MNLKEKKMLITSGGTLEKWDNVRGHTNLAKGAIGCYLAEEALKQGAEVIYLHGYFAKLPEHHPKMRLIPFEGIEDLGEKIKKIVQSEPVDVVIMAAAGSDWVVDKVLDQQGNPVLETGKMSSDEPPIIRFKKAPKVLSQIKTWNPDVLLVGFKLEHTDDPDYLFQRANLRMETSGAEYMVANKTGSLYGEEAEHYIVSKGQSPRKYASKKETAEGLIHILAGNMN
ncbi:phosphopantothenoylcysteine decarboxylase [Rossellomorea sp. YZS02]|uniref:phosphopantothenoylcysteine decarboxylase domain-containing protein n=1 Tax=Rossellomorea sp. YZS02 TaxID=3097358 RepID=UPI002A12676D|nr:phosphopantothenoylcysteine decarboxylase [Rossellomorea sp. YZS02]MDX8342221.1 phosphopantothenoylcysteine decarboxylase [Rossellomorea sp. YZS02]